MAFGIKKEELDSWKMKVARGEIAFLTHYWQDPRFSEAKTVTKVGCSSIEVLAEWGAKYGLKKEWIHQRQDYPHFDLLGDFQRRILEAEGLHEHLSRFSIRKDDR
ncbi:hypothetical protein [Litchfieldia salsa]|uniref:YneQ n=1 Tax=Litchfieldia salsa TaxID=930152 RepID=A0A1H0SSK3_9BACI|nr:hypothetical protein [Litchfieldia salsa]SDP44585.1 hypothetical protein SAMN05216565_10391 [Litchfieldia salsa]